MKKLFILFLLTVLCLTGCRSITSSENTSTTAESTTSSKDINAECFYEINGIRIVPGEDFAEALDKLGEPLEYKEAASCYYDGMDKIYSYDGFEITTYPVKDRDFVQDICISSDSLKTDKGITVGSSLEDVIKAYGEDYELKGKMYRYFCSDDTYRYFFITNDAVKYFGYGINADN